MAHAGKTIPPIDPKADAEAEKALARLAKQRRGRKLQGTSMAALALVGATDRIALLKQTLTVALDMAAQGTLDDASIARLREIGSKA